MASEAKRWALLIGINDYRRQASDLRGCVADVYDIGGILQNNLQVPSDCISVFLSPQQLQGVPFGQSLGLPSKSKVIRELARLQTVCQPGDFLYIHYSGHGDRTSTAHADKKGVRAIDEVICTLDGDISDVEFGDLLDAFTDQGVNIYATLDCCHSGGATRVDDDEAVRCRSTEDQQPSDVAQLADDNSRDGRNASVVKSWLHRDRQYVLLAACQPHERAYEYEAPDGSRHGTMTFFLTETLRNFGSPVASITYDRLERELKAKCVEQRKLKNKIQQPMLLGPRSTILFSTSDTLLTAHAQIVNQTAGVITLDQGSAHNVAKGDRYAIYAPVFLGVLTDRSKPLTHVQITQVEDFQCKAEPLSEGGVALDSIQVGSVAVLAQRAEAGIVKVLGGWMPFSRNRKNALQSLRQQWSNYDQLDNPLQLYFGRSSEPVNLFVGIDQSDTFYFKDRNNNLMPNIPPVKISDERMTEKVMFLLRHLWSYQRIAMLKHDSKMAKPKYDFKLVEDEVDPDDNKSLAAWKIHFKNLHSQVLYVTILNLTPAYGISQMYPGQDANSEAVDPGKEIEDLIIDIHAPKLIEALYKGRGFTMTDVIKVIVTTEQISLRDMQMDDLDEDFSPDAKRNCKLSPRKMGSWFVDEKPIVTTTA